MEYLIKLKVLWYIATSLFSPAAVTESTQVTIVPTAIVSQSNPQSFGDRIALGLEEVSYDYADYWSMYLNSDRIGTTMTETDMETWARRSCNEATDTIDIDQVHRNFYLLYVDFVIGYTNDSIISATRAGTTPTSSLVDPKEIYGLVLHEAVTIQCTEKPITGVLNLNE